MIIYLVVIALLIYIMIPVYKRARILSVSISCHEHLNQIGQSILAYQKEYDGFNPPSLEILSRAERNKPYYLPPDLLICPGRKSDDNETCSYIYRGDDLSKDNPNELIWAYDKFNNHGNLVNILRATGTFSKYTEDHIKVLIDKDNELRRELGLAEKPLETRGEIVDKAD